MFPHICKCVYVRNFMHLFSARRYLQLQINILKTQAGAPWRIPGNIVENCVQLQWKLLIINRLTL